MSVNPEVSIIIPTYNEGEIICKTIKKVIEVIASKNISAEIVVVDDGSTDSTGKIVDHLSSEHSLVQAFHHRRNLGQSEALATGFHNSRGKIIVFFDADLQYDPQDISCFIKIVKEGKYDIVTGWRKTRKKAEPLTKRIAAEVYNRLCKALFHVTVHDFNCGLRAIKREAMESIPPRAGFHRNILAIASAMGYKICEIPINERRREKGKTKYGIRRLLEGSMDLIALKLNLSVSKRPMLIFGTLGLLSFTLGFIFGIYLVIEKFLFDVSIVEYRLPFLLLAVLLMIAGLEFLSFGFLADSLSRISDEIKDLRKRRMDDGK